MRESGDLRINPSFFSSRRYYLKQLRRKIEKVNHQYIAGNDRPDLIDFGCGNSPYLPIIIPNIKKYIKADLPINPNRDISINENGTLPVDDNQFNIVLSTQVLEHVDDPLLYLAESRRVLMKNGILILSTHGYWMFHPDPNDYWRWTSAGLEKIIKSAGFNILYFEGILGRNASGLQLFQDGLIFKIPGFLRPIWAVIMQSFISIFDKLNSKAAINRDACTFVVVAEVE